MDADPRADQVDQLDRLFREAQADGKRLQRFQLAATLGLIVVVLGSLGAIYAKGASMYTQEAFRESLGPEMEALKPSLEATMRDVVQETGPHYAQLGRERLQKVLPKVQTELESELVGMSTNLAENAMERVSVSFERVQNDQLELVRKHFPETTDEQFEELQKKWAREIQTDTTELLGSFRERVLTDFSTLNNTLEGFRPNRFDDFERDQLVRYYAHLWLTLVDEEILAGDSQEKRDG